MASTTVDVLEKIEKLVALAQTDDKGKPTEEARTAAVTAIKLLKDNDLVIVPREKLEAAEKAVEGAKAMRLEAKKAKRDGMLVGAALGLFAGKQGLL